MSCLIKMELIREQGVRLAALISPDLHFPELKLSEFAIYCVCILSHNTNCCTDSTPTQDKRSFVFAAIHRK